MTTATDVAAEAAWLDDLAHERAWRSAHYAGEESPLAPEARARFPGLQWFPPDPRYRLRGVRLERHAAPRQAALAATGEDAIAFLDVGIVRFTLDGVACALLAFEPAPGEVEATYLFLPFRDATSGRETYGAGRYLDVKPRADDAYEIDFNRAYHPYCAFDDRWTCTLPPPQNRLTVRIPAGERL